MKTQYKFELYYQEFKLTEIYTKHQLKTRLLKLFPFLNNELEGTTEDDYPFLETLEEISTIYPTALIILNIENNNNKENYIIVNSNIYF